MIKLKQSKSIFSSYQLRADDLQDLAFSFMESLAIRYWYNYKPYLFYGFKRIFRASKDAVSAHYEQHPSSYGRFFKQVFSVSS